MKRTNRVFFYSEEEALLNGYRPCGHCMKAAYKNGKWISLIKRSIRIRTGFPTMEQSIIMVNYCRKQRQIFTWNNY
ncbi:hypothetical protein LWM68_10115 [Niabella sp. W65]|nr:hypothetical protein [Niabella sp. W65]MCH7363093.1 hypothetical protein [Niabella sp. W65]ULT46407.1 hypothetical protein KRR40_28795 [Niabella sp. I65]